MSSGAKAGAIVGGILILVSFVVYIIYSKVSTSDGEKKPSEKPAVTTVASQTETKAPVTESQSAAQTYAQSELVRIDEESLKSLTAKQATEMGYISRKNIYLQGNQLYYVIDVMLADNSTVNYYVSESGYFMLEVNDKVSVNYTVYTNANGLSFVQVASITTIE